MNQDNMDYSIKLIAESLETLAKVNTEAIILFKAAMTNAAEVKRTPDPQSIESVLGGQITHEALEALPTRPVIDVAFLKKLCVFGGIQDPNIWDICQQLDFHFNAAQLFKEEAHPHRFILTIDFDGSPGVHLIYFDGSSMAISASVQNIRTSDWYHSREVLHITRPLTITELMNYEYAPDGMSLACTPNLTNTTAHDRGYGPDANE